MDLTTSYLGFNLRNPLIVGASSLTLDADAVRRCAAAGAGAVVLKSVFEEQVRMDNSGLTDALEGQESWHGEVFEYMEADIGMRYGTREYLGIIDKCKRAVDIPIIASINCVSDEWWQDFAEEVVGAGADALELNIAIMPHDLRVTSAEIEEQYVRIVTAARKTVNVPFAVKLGTYFSALPSLLVRLRQAGADGFVLFNRFYKPTVDVDNLRVIAGDRYSNPTETSDTLRWISLLAGRLNAGLSGATGVHSAEDTARLLLVGADTVQVVSALYVHGVDYLAQILAGLQTWMDTKGFSSLNDFRGRLSQAQNPEAELFGRCQYIKGLVGIE